MRRSLLSTAEDMVVRRIPLRDARTQLGLTQQMLTEGIGVHYNVISACENGRRVRRINAYRILEALNNQRAVKKMEPLTLEQIDWQIWR